MFDVASSELIVLGAVALLVIPPKDLPKAMRIAGHWIGKVRGIATQFRSGFDSMIRESELAEMEKKWAAENERIMREHPASPQMMAISDLPESSMPGEPQGAPDGDAPPVLVAAPVVAPALPEPVAHAVTDGAKATS